MTPEASSVVTSLWRCWLKKSLIPSGFEIRLPYVPGRGWFWALRDRPLPGALSEPFVPPYCQCSGDVGPPLWQSVTVFFLRASLPLGQGEIVVSS